MQNFMNSVKMTKPNKNVFDLSHDVKLSLNMGELVPIMVMDCVPGDKVQLSCESLLRFAPLVAPVMHSIAVTMHYFFVPNRLIWPGWEQFITTGLVDPAAPAPPTYTIEPDGSNYTRLMDYLGFPSPVVNAGTISDSMSPMAMAAYQFVYNEYYRDQNLQPEVNYTLIDGDNSAQVDLHILRNRAWEHDYFTSALPFAQKGDPVDIPIGDVRLVDAWSAEGIPVFEDTTGVAVGAGDIIQNSDPEIQSTGVAGEPVAYNPNGTLQVEPVTINTLRMAFKLQEWAEKAMRSGSRYIENIRAFFGVQSSDKRLQRPEYITGTKSPVIISEVLQTAESGTTPQGNMAGHGVSVTTGKYGSYFCEEHGWIIGIMSVLPKTAYSQGIPKMYLRRTVSEYFWPQFANLGEQQIENRELMAYKPGPADPFGYIPRYGEYRYLPNRIAGDFRDTLDYWHMGRDFAAAPALNSAFITADPTHRIFAVTDPSVQKLYCHVLNKIKAVRPIPKYGTPTF